MSLADRIRRHAEEIAKNPPESSWKLRPEILTEGQIPQPLHEVAPRNILGQPWWNKTRKAAYASTDFHCVACGIHKSLARFRQWLEAHEVYEIDYLRGRMYYRETVPLCTCCHSYIHQGRLRWLLDTHRISAERYVAIIQHGDSILRKHGLERKIVEGPFADWKDWRLVIGRKHYKPKYKSLQDWHRRHPEG